jgi:hypothetical protein
MAYPEPGRSETVATLRNMWADFNLLLQHTPGRPIPVELCIDQLVLTERIACEMLRTLMMH